MSEDLSLYIDKCRCCYASVDGDERSSEISKIIERRFYFLSNVVVSLRDF